MRTGRMIALLLLLCVVVSAQAPALAVAQDTAGTPKEAMGPLVVILSTDDLASADAALMIAGVAAGRGHKVTLLLRVRGIQLALKDTDYKIDNTTMQNKLAAFMAAGSRVFVGGACMKKDGIPKDRLIDGVQVGTPDTVMGMLFEEGARIICQ